MRGQFSSEGDFIRFGTWRDGSMMGGGIVDNSLGEKEVPDKYLI